MAYFGNWAEGDEEDEEDEEDEDFDFEEAEAKRVKQEAEEEPEDISQRVFSLLAMARDAREKEEPSVEAGYVVHKVLGTRVTPEGARQYLVLWRGGHSSSTCMVPTFVEGGVMRDNFPQLVMDFYEANSHFVGGPMPQPHD